MHDPTRLASEIHTCDDINVLDPSQINLSEIVFEVNNQNRLFTWALVQLLKKQLLE